MNMDNAILRAGKKYGYDGGAVIDYINSSSAANNISPDFAKAILFTESRFNPNANSGQARGIAQFTPETARKYGVDTNNIYSSIAGETRLLGNLSNRYGGDYLKAAAAYNGGAGAVDYLFNKHTEYLENPEPRNGDKKHDGLWKVQTADYVKKIRSLLGMETAAKEAGGGSTADGSSDSKQGDFNDKVAKGIETFAYGGGKDTSGGFTEYLTDVALGVTAIGLIILSFWRFNK